MVYYMVYLFFKKPKSMRVATTRPLNHFAHVAYPTQLGNSFSNSRIKKFESLTKKRIMVVVSIRSKKPGISPKKGAIFFVGYRRLINEKDNVE